MMAKAVLFFASHLSLSRLGLDWNFFGCWHGIENFRQLLDWTFPCFHKRNAGRQQKSMVFILITLSPLGLFSYKTKSAVFQDGTHPTNMNVQFDKPFLCQLGFLSDLLSETAEAIWYNILLRPYRGTLRVSIYPQSKIHWPPLVLNFNESSRHILVQEA